MTFICTALHFCTACESAQQTQHLPTCRSADLKAADIPGINWSVALLHLQEEPGSTLKVHVSACAKIMLPCNEPHETQQVVTLE
jgi:hypothetical protein